MRAAAGEVGSNLMTFADLNNDKYTDIITVNEDYSSYTIHIFDPVKNMFNSQKTFKPNNCAKITNIAVGRSSEKLRLFVTCSLSNGATVLQFYDKAKTLEFS